MKIKQKLSIPIALVLTNSTLSAEYERDKANKTATDSSTNLMWQDELYTSTKNSSP